MLLLPSELWARATTAWKKLPFDLVASTIVSGLNQSFGSQYFNISSSQCKIAVRALQSTRLGGGWDSISVAAIFMQWIHCFVVKVIEVTILRDLCGMVHSSFRCEVEKS